MSDAFDELELDLDLEDARNARPTREMDVRKAEANIVWQPASNLPDPDQRPGWVHRWVRTSHSGSSPDPTNMAKAMREGWQPVSALDYPELASLQFDRSANKDVIEFGGLILCRISVEKAKAREAYFTGLAKRQLGAVNERLRDGAGNDERLQFESQVKTEVKRTSR